MPSESRPITIAIGALGGQGGGVLSNWIVDTAERCNYLAQSTAVAGVAQRTGATIYCIEVFPCGEGANAGREPVLALYPVPGDVDVMIGAELAEAGRAVQRGFVTPGETTLIASIHRVYSMNERVVMGDARASNDKILEAARAASKRLIAFDMNEPATRHGSVISAVLLGALAGSEALPFPREAFEASVKAGGRGVEQSLAAFDEGYRRAQSTPPAVPDVTKESAGVVDLMVTPATTDWGRERQSQWERDLPQPCWPIVSEGVRRCADYQDRRYAESYLDQVLVMSRMDAEAGGGADDFLFTREYARYFALRMCYEDTIRVADLKTRATRFTRFRKDVRADDDQIVQVVEYMHPRVEEICDTLPAWIARRILASRRLRRWTTKVVGGGRNFTTTHLSGFLPQAFLVSLKRWRRGTFRYGVEQERIAHWNRAIESVIARDRELAIELVRCARLIKGYGETHERGLGRYERILEFVSSSSKVSAQRVRELRDAALADEDGESFDSALQQAA